MTSLLITSPYECVCHAKKINIRVVYFLYASASASESTSQPSLISDFLIQHFYLMGVTGLLQNLKEIQHVTSLEKYRGQTLAIDAYGWLHRGLIACAQELCQDQPTRKYITLFMNKIDMLRHFGVIPYVVFDGAALPTKAETARERRQRREEARMKADLLAKQGKRLLAWKEFMKAALVTSLMAKSIMVELDLLGIKYIVAPYEADPQMVYLELAGLADGIISEDSDLLIFGCKTLITKLKDNGSCVEVCRDDFGKVKLLPYLSRYTQEELRLVAMLSGCDYTKGIAGIGLKTAFNLVKRYSTIDKLLHALRVEGKTIDGNFMDEATKANYAFQFQKVFDPVNMTVTPLMPYPEGFEVDFEVLEACCGRTFDFDLYKKLCRGEIHPHTHEILVSREQALTCLKSPSVSSGISSVVRGRPSLILDMLSASRPTPNAQRQPPVKAQRTQTAPNMKLSPCSRKVIRIQGTRDEACGGTTSKFFETRSVLESSQTSSLPTPDCSMMDFIAKEEEEVNDFSSPVKSMPLLDGSDDILTDDDSQQIEHTEDAEISKEIPIIDTATKAGPNPINSDGFDFDEFDEDLEESPLKKETLVPPISQSAAKESDVMVEQNPRSEKLDQFRNVLRNSFLFNANTTLSHPSNSKRIKLMQRTRMASAEVQLPITDEMQTDSADSSPTKRKSVSKRPTSPTKSRNSDKLPALNAQFCAKEIKVCPAERVPRQSLLLFAYMG